MEWLWHVSETDEPLGRVERADAHARMIRHRAGVVFLVDGAGGHRVYLARRAASKRIFPATYDSSASFHVAHGERYDEAAVRESFEELGLRCALTEIGKFSHSDPPEHQFVAVFAMHHTGEVIALDPTEASSGGFYALDDAARIVREHACTPWLRDGLPLLMAWLASRDREA